MNKIFIGDNLKIMQSSQFAVYNQRVNFIYIDPPYNTVNNTFAFNDKNDKWADDIAQRLTVAKNLLCEEGVIFISIDNNELSNLLQTCYNIFGKENYVGVFVTKQAQRSNAKHINTIHEYIICFAKYKKHLPRFYIPRLNSPKESKLLKNVITRVKNAYAHSADSAKAELKKQIDKYINETGTTWIKNYTNIDSQGNIYFAKDLSTPGKPNSLDINEIGLHLKPLKTRRWSSKEKFITLHKQNRLAYKNGRPYEIEYINEATDNVSSILDFYSRQGTNDLKKLGLYGLFDTAKPVEMIKFLVRCSQHKDANILDFYAGSGTTAQAVYEVNKQDNTNHQYLLIQLNEKINEKSDAYEIMTKKGYLNPTVDQVMLLRINTYLELNKAQIDYEVVKMYE